MSTPQLRSALAATAPTHVASVRQTLLALAAEASSAAGLFLSLLTAMCDAQDTELVDTALVGAMLERPAGRGLAYERLRACGGPGTADLLESLVRELSCAHAKTVSLDHDIRTDLATDTIPGEWT